MILDQVVDRLHLLVVVVERADSLKHLRGPIARIGRLEDTVGALHALEHLRVYAARLDLVLH